MATTLPAEELATRAVDPMRVGDGDGLVHRLGGIVRYSVSRLGSNDAGFDVYVEGGAGLQHLRWDDGGMGTRPDLSLGMGIGTWVLGETDHVSLTVGLRVTLAPRSDVKGAPPACAGPCDQPTPPTGVDRSFLFDLTIRTAGSHGGSTPRSSLTRTQIGHRRRRRRSQASPRRSHRHPALPRRPRLRNRLGARRRAPSSRARSRALSAARR
ncbi:MAG: hypothetical protein SFX73_33280 [Kofleriaceae bacterium]|nr:hypothetical protein [Kofleriaceae bacterium]